MVVILIDSRSTHNFINRKLAKELNYFPYQVKNFQVMVANSGILAYRGKCHNVKITMGDYQLDSLMYGIPMGGIKMVLGV